MDRGERRRRSKLKENQRIERIRNWWGSKGTFGWDSIPDTDSLKIRIKKTLKTRFLEGRRMEFEDCPDRKIVKEARRGKWADGYEE